MYRRNAVLFNVSDRAVGGESEVCKISEIRGQGGRGTYNNFMEIDWLNLGMQCTSCR